MAAKPVTAIFNEEHNEIAVISDDGSVWIMNAKSRMWLRESWPVPNSGRFYALKPGIGATPQDMNRQPN